MTDHTLPRHKNARNDLTAEYVRSILDYNPETGEFRWKYRSDVGKAWNTRYSGNKTGYIGSDGRLHVTINNKPYLIHRIAWIYVYGFWPKYEIDHIDGNPINNVISNLRECSATENMRHRGRQSNNKCGLKGVHWAKNVKKWRARIRVDCKDLHLGLFDTSEQAHKAYCDAAEKYFGEFSRTK